MGKEINRGCACWAIYCVKFYLVNFIFTDMCWAIVTSEAVAVGYKIKHMETDLLELASKELLDCCEVAETCYPNKLSRAFEWVEANGLRKEENYPFETEKGACRPKTEQEVMIIQKCN